MFNIKKWFKKDAEFPCKEDECLVRGGCTQICDKLIMDKIKLKDFFMEHKRCPDCGSESFIMGPSGGLSQNMECSDCEHWFNVALPVFIERIHIDHNGCFY